MVLFTVIQILTFSVNTCTVQTSVSLKMLGHVFSKYLVKKKKKEFESKWLTMTWEFKLPVFWNFLFTFVWEASWKNVL